MGLLRLHDREHDEMKLVHSGKVRDIYELDGGDLLLVASDRVSVYDVSLSKVRKGQHIVLLTNANNSLQYGRPH